MLNYWNSHAFINFHHFFYIWKSQIKILWCIKFFILDLGNTVYLGLDHIFLVAHSL